VCSRSVHSLDSPQFLCTHLPDIYSLQHPSRTITKLHLSKQTRYGYPGVRALEGTSLLPHPEHSSLLVTALWCL
jgi:hypothetical protein